MLKIYEDLPDEAAVRFCRDFMDAPVEKRYVLGRNEYAVSLSECVDIAGFIDDYTDEKTFLDKPVVKMDGVPNDSLVVSAVLFVVPLSGIANLEKCGLRCLDYFSFQKYADLALKKIEFMEDSRKDIREHQKRYEAIFERLADHESKRIFEKFINFRLSSDLSYLEGFTNHQEDQYFEDFLEFVPGDVFVDAGGFDGQTSIDFILNCPKYRSVHFFEPDPENIKIAQDRLGDFENISYYNCGVGDAAGNFLFSSGGGSASTVSASGDIEVRIDTVDQLVEEPVSFIKMDIEGFEMQALDGAKNHIMQDHPKLAICCYHKFDDLRVIPEKIFGFRDDYDLYLRHYTEGLHESVWYFIPRS